MYKRQVDASEPDIDVELLTPNPYSRSQEKTDKITGIVIHYTANPGATAIGNRNYFEGLKDSHETVSYTHLFTTSTLQQEASKALNFATSKTMRIAQQLYEGVDVKGSGTVGIITYLRTDSTRISEEADANVRSYIGEQYGSQYVAAEGARKSGSQKDVYKRQSLHCRVYQSFHV